MTTDPVFQQDAYLQMFETTVTDITPEGGVIVAGSNFYPTGGGQPGDCGHLSWESGQVAIATTVKGDEGSIILVPQDRENCPSIGSLVTLQLDWARRYSLMKVHTALHLLSVVIPFGVTGGSISEGKGRLDFAMDDPPEDKEAIAIELNRLIATNAAVTESWISDEELDAQPELVKTMSVKPPRGSGRIRLIRIGEEQDTIDLQPCGGTHVARLGEIGKLRLGKVEKKGRMNRRVYLHLDD